MRERPPRGEERNEGDTIAFEQQEGECVGCGDENAAPQGDGALRQNVDCDRRANDLYVGEWLVRE